MNSSITRRILNFVIGLHRSAVFKECEALDRATERAFDNADQQKQVVAAEQRRLEDCAPCAQSSRRTKHGARPTKNSHNSNVRP